MVKAATAKEPVASASPKEKAVNPICMCGCGEQTKGGRFAMGHDARLKGKLLKAAAHNEVHGEQTTVTHYDPETKADKEVDPRDALEDFNWIHFLPKTLEKARKQKDIVDRKVEREATKEDKAARVAGMKHAAQLVKDKELKGEDDKPLKVTKDNWESIVEEHGEAEEAEAKPKGRGRK